MSNKNSEAVIPDGFKGERAIVTPYNVRHFQANNEITKLIYVTHIGYYPNARYHYRYRETGAPENILIYCEKGNGWIEHGNVRSKILANQAYIIPANEKHKYEADNQNPWSIYWCHFKGERVDMFNSIIGRKLEIGDPQNSRSKDRFILFEEMYQNLEMGYSTENLEYISFCLMHFIASLKYIPQFREMKNVKIDDVIQKSINFMKDNLENRITLDNIATAVGYSSSHLNTLFTHKTSYSPMVYYNQLRIQRACSYLQFSGLKIKEIAFTLGYYDPFHFSKAFLKEMQITPKEYRARYREDENRERSVSMP